jgi:hypothetical protein
MGTYWFMPALVKRRFGESGIRLEEGTIVCPFDLKKSKKDCLISALVMCLLLILPQAIAKIPAANRGRD